MENNKPQKFLIEAVNQEDLAAIEEFIQQRKLKAFKLEDPTRNENDIINDMVRVLIPLIR